MEDFDFKEEIKKLVKVKQEENYLFYFAKSFYVSRNGNIRFITHDAVSPLIRDNPNLEVWHIYRDCKEEIPPCIPTGLNVKTMSISSVGTFHYFLQNHV